MVAADIDLARTMTAKRWFDVVGHYGHEDVLRRSFEPELRRDPLEGGNGGLGEKSPESPGFPS